MNADSDQIGGADASRVWAELQKFVAAQDRRRTLHLELGLGVTKAELLIALAEAPMTLREIAQSFDADPPTATVTVDRLEHRGLVRRGPHPDDNRRKLVHLTDAGLEASAAAERIIKDPPGALIALDASDIAALASIFAALNSPAAGANTEERETP